MLTSILLYVGAAIPFIWGLAHILKTRAIVDGFAPLTPDNRQIITQEWVAEGLALCFIGLLVLIVAVWGERGGISSLIVYRGAALMLIVMAVLTALTGARIPLVPFKACPLILTVAAAAIFLGTLL
jgi:hypothetical protein